MMLEGFTITPVNIRAASDREYALANAFGNRMRAESMPDDPPIPLAEFVEGCHHIPEQVDVFVWMVFSDTDDSLIASASIGIAHFGHNDHIANADIAVLPEYRRKGIASHMLREIANVAREQQRTLIMTGTRSRVPAGDAFLETIGAERGLVSHMNQLKVDELEKSLLDSWLADPEDSAPEFDIILEQGPYAEAELAAITDFLNEAYNSIPRGKLKMEDHKFTPEQLRQFEQSTFIGGRERWAAFARHRESKGVRGFHGSWMASQSTYVSRPARHGGASAIPSQGPWRRLKAAMLVKLMAVHPEIEFVRTDNAYVNAAMLQINNALGFKPYQTERRGRSKRTRYSISSDCT